MNRMIRFLRGETRLRVTGADPAQCMNQFTRAQIPFWGTAREDELHLSVSVLSRDCTRAEEMALRAYCSVEVVSERGLRCLLRPLKKRPVLAIGAVAAVFLSFFLQSFVWVIAVEGEKTVHEEEIVHALEEIGIQFGAWAPGIDSQLTKMQMLNAVPQLSWLAVNRTGGKLTVPVTERFSTEAEPPSYPAGSLVALRDGLITDYSIHEGMRLCKRGDVVKEGQILVSGYEDYGLYLRAVCADGEIYAQTWHSGAVATPAQRMVKRYTGVEWTQKTLLVGRKRINLCGNSGISVGSCDKMIDIKRVQTPGYSFPLAIETATYREYELIPVEKTAAQANRQTREAWEMLTRMAMVAGQIEKTEESFSRSGEYYVLRAESTCNEMIARLVPIGEPYS